MFAFKLTVTYNYFYRISRQQHHYYTTTELGYHTAKTWKASFLVKNIKYWRPIQFDLDCFDYTQLQLCLKNIANTLYLNIFK